MLLSARFDDGSVAAQRSVPVEKTNEITVFAPMLDQVSDADLDGTVVTADQLHTQRGHARYIHRRHGYYVFTVGENQTKLFAALDALPWQHIAVQDATVDRGHGRIEIRTIRTLPVTDKIATLFPHAAQAFLLERYIYDYKGEQLGAVAVLGITSLSADQADGSALLAYVRGHWSIESLHWLRDAVLGEDDSRLASAARAMAALRNLVVSIFRLRGITRISRQLRECGRDPYRRPLVLLGLAHPT
jgi:predicted transposase YbfD/YdcC